MKASVLLLCILLVTSCIVSADPPELTAARASYQNQIRLATDPINTKYLAYLDNLKKSFGAKGQLEAAQNVQNEIDTIRATSSEFSTTTGDRIILWNQNNGGKGDRGTTKVNVTLLSVGREVWKKRAQKIDWDMVNMTKVELAVPPELQVDQIRVEVTDTVNGKGGLAEVEYIRGNRNIATGGEVKVSAVWENNQNHTGAALTDGVQTTYWLIPDDQEGWAEITLKL